MFGPAAGSDGVTTAFLRLCDRADVALDVPAAIGELCCGTPWKSKGLLSGHALMQKKVLPLLWEATGHDYHHLLELLEQTTRS